MSSFLEFLFGKARPPGGPGSWFNLRFCYVPSGSIVRRFVTSVFPRLPKPAEHGCIPATHRLFKVRTPFVVQERFGVVSPCKNEHAQNMKTSKLLRTISAIAAAITVTFAASSVHAANLFGIDVSSYQGTVNWTSVHGNGAQFAFAKSTEGTSITDSQFTANITHGKNAGMQMGAYHFAHPDVDCPSAEANHFWNVAGPYMLADGKTICPAVDLGSSTTTVCQPNLVAWFNTFQTDVKAKTTNSIHCIIIVSCCSACNFSGTMLAPWLVQYNGENLYTGNPWSTCCNCDVWDTGGKCNVWDFWQVTSTGAIGGVSGNCDFDAFNGTLSFLKSSQGIGGI